MAAAHQPNIDYALAQNMEIGSQLLGRSKITLACMRVHSRRRKETVVTSMSPSRHRRHVSRLQGHSARSAPHYYTRTNKGVGRWEEIA